MVNAPLLKYITGAHGPEAGPTAQDYDGHLYALGDENTPSNVKGNFEGVKSVATLDEESDHPMAQIAAKITRTPTQQGTIPVGRVKRT